MQTITEILSQAIENFKNSNTYKYEIPLESPQGAVVKVKGKKVVMLASNNYLGLASHPKIKKAVIDGVKKYGPGMASVRFICGTNKVHLELEKKISSFLKCEDTILYLSCFSANEGLFAGFLNDRLGFDNYKDVIYSDRLNHASIIDGARLCKAETTDRKIYEHRDVNYLQRLLEEDKDKNYRFKIIATDGVFSMEGDLAPLPELVSLAKKYKALLVVDDSHALGVLGKTGRGTPEELNVLGQIDIITGTLGKAMGGAVGGFISGKRDVISYLRQTSRPYIFSNSLPPCLAYSAMKAFELLQKDKSLVKKLRENTSYFRKEIKNLGYKIIDGIHPIVPIMLGEASLAQNASFELLKEGVYIKGLWFPVVPRGEARLRGQISAAHSKKDLDKALNAFQKVGKRLKII
ncbi:MAG TPA: glycine C-acetyltransferase [candidate division Zixibacteria bacterium]|nr:glycine C-acetyltransferase [candidate division Zixibacteria bacterium]